MCADPRNDQGIEARLRELGLVLPAPVKVPSGVRLPFAFVRVRGNRAFVSGHGPQNPDGSIADLRGKVGADLTPEEGYQAARLTALTASCFERAKQATARWIEAVSSVPARNRATIPFRIAWAILNRQAGFEG